MTFSTMKIVLGGLLFLFFLVALNSLFAGFRQKGRQSTATRPFAPGSAARADFWAATCLILAGTSICFSCWFHFSVALADPAAGAPEVGLFFLLDCSPSMLADGIAASRLEEARSLIADLAARHPHLLASLVTFADNALLDFPPSLAEGGFLAALSAAAPDLGYIPGSSPGAALRLAQDTARVSELQPVLILLSDGEVNVADFAHERSLWASRSASILMVVIGALEKPCPIPWQGGWMIDPDTGLEAKSQTTASQLTTLASLSPEPWQLLANPDQEILAKQLQLLLKAETKTCAMSTSLLLSKMGILAALALLLVWMMLKQGVLQPHKRQMPHQITSNHALACLLMATMTINAQTKASSEDKLPTAAEEVAARQEKIIQQLAHGKLPNNERARLLNNWAALLIADHKAKTEPEKAYQDALEAVTLCREALRLQPALKPAMNNLTAARQKLRNLEAKITAREEELSSPVAATEENANASTALQHEKHQPEKQENSLETNKKTPSQTDKISHLAAAAEATTAPENETAHASDATERGGTWKQMQKKRQVIPGRKPGVKPW